MGLTVGIVSYFESEVTKEVRRFARPDRLWGPISRDGTGKSKLGAGWAEERRIFLGIIVVREPRKIVGRHAGDRPAAAQGTTNAA